MTGAVMNNVLVCVTVFWTAWGGHAWALEGGDAAHVVRELHESITAMMKNGDALGYEGRYQTIAPVIDQTHDLDRIARLVAGRHWKQFTEAQRDAFVQTFRDLSVSTYAGRFKTYGGERFDVLSEQPLPRGARTLVTGHFVKADGERMTFHYIVHPVRDQWKIINISVNGVSDVALKRAEYGAILKQDGLPTLLQRLRDQIQDHARGL